MTLPSLHNGITIPMKLSDLGCAAKVACAIVGIPSSRLSLCVGGIQDLSAADAAALHALCEKLSEIQQAIPFPLAFKNADKWREILNRMERENISVESIAAAMDLIFKQS